MSFFKFTLLCLAATILVLSGCSGDGRLTDPAVNSSNTVEFARGQYESPVSINENSPESLKEALGGEDYIQTFEATLRKSYVEWGCWYLETDKGERYTPYFDNDPPQLEVGKRLVVAGQIDRRMNSYCMIGPVFRVKKYLEISTGPDDLIGSSADLIENSETDSEINDHGAINSEQPWPEDRTMLKGYFGQTEMGCPYLYNEKGIIAELMYVKHDGLRIRNGAIIAVSGSYSMLTWSPCQMAPLFNVENFTILKNIHAKAERDREEF